MSTIELQTAVVSERQAVEIASNWLKEDTGQILPLIGAFYMPAVDKDESDGFVYSRPARWLVSFQCNAPEGFEPNHIDLYVDPVTGDVEAPPMM